MDDDELRLRALEHAQEIMKSVTHPYSVDDLVKTATALYNFLKGTPQNG